MKTEDDFAGCLGCLGVIIGLASTGALIYIIIHFIAKYW